MDHAYHSEFAKNATGADAKPPPKKPFVRNSRRKFSDNTGSKKKKGFLKGSKSGHKFKRHSRGR
jgi:hypothetical protein